MRRCHSQRLGLLDGHAIPAACKGSPRSPTQHDGAYVRRRNATHADTALDRAASTATTIGRMPGSYARTAWTTNAVVSRCHPRTATACPAEGRHLWCDAAFPGSSQRPVTVGPAAHEPMERWSDPVSRLLRRLMRSDTHSDHGVGVRSVGPSSVLPISRPSRKTPPPLHVETAQRGVVRSPQPVAEAPHFRSAWRSRSCFPRRRSRPGRTGSERPPYA